MWGYKLVQKNARQRANKDTGVNDAVDMAICYPPSLTKAVERYIQLYLNENLTITTLKDYITEYQKQVDRIIGLLPEIKERTTVLG